MGSLRQFRPSSAQPPFAPLYHLRRKSGDAAELTHTADEAFLRPSDPTARHGVTDLDLLGSGQILPLERFVARNIRWV